MFYRTGRGCSKEFFNGTDVRNYFSSFYSKMKTEVEQMSDAEIVSCNFEEWADYLATKYSVVPISIFETNIEKTLSETKVKRANPFRGHPYERDFFEIDGVRVTFKIPFDGEPDLFELQPGSRILSRFATQSFVSPMMKNAEVLRWILNIQSRSFKIKVKQWLSMCKNSLKMNLVTTKR